MKDNDIARLTIITAACCVALILMIVGFEGRGKELRKQQEAYAELQNEYNYLKFNGADVQNCPLCGSNEIGLGNITNDYYVICKECRMQSSWCETVQEAIEAWNSLKKVEGM